MRKPPRLPPEQLAPVLLTFPDPPAPFDWAAVFGNARPVELEVGFGKGLFLVTEAQARPEVNFVGVEIERKYHFLTATRLVKRGLTNVRVLAGDAKRLLAEFTPAASLAAVHVYFPDPWWKKRHHKRRVFTAAFVAEVVRVLAPGGLLSAATDVEEYYHVMAALTAAHPGLAALPPPDEHAPDHDMDYMTNFERKARKAGKPIHRLRCVKA